MKLLVMGQVTCRRCVSSIWKPPGTGAKQTLILLDEVREGAG